MHKGTHKDPVGNGILLYFIIFRFWKNLFLIKVLEEPLMEVCITLQCKRERRPVASDLAWEA